MLSLLLLLLVPFSLVRKQKENEGKGYARNTIKSFLEGRDKNPVLRHYEGGSLL